MGPCADTRCERGFTIVEVIAAMAVLLVGLGGTLKVYDGVASTAATAKLREQGVSLQRELVEAARSLRYADLGPGTVVPRLQAVPALGDASGEPGWQLRRRGITYTVAVGACTVDDPRDGTGTRDLATACATGAGTTTHATCTELLGSSGSIQGEGSPSGPAAGDCGIDADLDGQVDGLIGGPAGSGPDLNPNDYKRVVVLVRWREGGGSRYVLQDATVPYPGAASAIVVTGLSAAPNPVTGATSVLATATTDRTAEAVSWSVDGELGDPAAAGGADRTWTFSWSLGSVSPLAPGSVPAAGEVVDGTYVVSAKAFDRLGVAGPERAETVVVSRRAPFSVPGQVLRNDGTSVVVGWTPSRERDIAAYRVYRRSAGTTALVCTVERARSCRDAAPPAGTSEFWVVAVDASSEGDLPATLATATLGGTPPGEPTSVAATRTGTSVTVTWSAPAGGAASYRVYRDGTALGDLLGSTTALSFTDAAAGTTPRDYSVSALDANGVESAPTAPVTR